MWTTRGLLALFMLIDTCITLDSVVWSTSPISVGEISQLIYTASQSSPVLLFALEDFTLAQFSKHVKAYDSEHNTSSLASVIRKSKHYDTGSIKNKLQLPPDSLVLTYEQLKNKPICLLFVESWDEMEKFVIKIAKELEDYVVIVSSPEAFAMKQAEKRRKRVAADVILSMEDEEELQKNSMKMSKGKGQRSSSFAAVRANEEQYLLPVVLPPFCTLSSEKCKTDVPEQDCALYMEGVEVIVRDGNTSSKYYTLSVEQKSDESNFKFAYDSSYIQCLKNGSKDRTAEFIVNLILPLPMTGYTSNNEAAFKLNSPVNFKLTFVVNALNYWGIQSIELMESMKIDLLVNDKQSILVNANSKAETTYMNIESVVGYAYGCSMTQAAFFSTSNKDKMVGIALRNVEVDLFMYKNKKDPVKFKFNRDVSDCVGTFSTGSWMGIISSFVMLSILMFGYLMLQSVQTVDRFDDPKQKQLVINFKE